MKRFVLRGIAAAIALFSFAVAQAVPVYVDFAGNVTQYTIPAVEGIDTGTAVTGGFTLDTDRLISSGPPLSGAQYTFLDYNPAGLTQPLASISFGGREITFPQFERSYAYINFVDGCRPSCDTGWAEGYSISAATQDVFKPGYTGLYHSYFLSLYVSASNVLPDFPYVQYFDAFDGAAMTPIDAFTLPTWRVEGNLLENVLDCVDGTCTTVSDGFFNFDLTSLTRGIGTRSVPEPGTFGLFVAALGGAWLLRRRKAALTRHR